MALSNQVKAVRSSTAPASPRKCILPRRAWPRCCRCAPPCPPLDAGPSGSLPPVLRSSASLAVRSGAALPAGGANMLTGSVVPAGAFGSRSIAANRGVGGGTNLAPPLLAAFCVSLAAGGATGRSMATSVGAGAGSSRTGLASDAARTSCQRARPERCASAAPSANDPPAKRTVRNHIGISRCMGRQELSTSSSSA